MSEAFLGEIRLFACNFAPRNWAFCNGQILLISQNAALFSLMGTAFGGNGQTTFALPNLQGRVPMQFATDVSNIGSTGGTATTTLQTQNLPPHTHSVYASAGGATVKTAAGNMIAAPEGHLLYGPASSLTSNSAMVGNAGGGQPYDNHQPYLVLNFCIAMVGIFPSRS